MGVKTRQQSSGSSDEDIDYRAAGRVMIKQLKEKLKFAQKFSEKIHILSVLPKNLGRQKIISKFGVFRYFADKLKECVAKDGVFCTTNPKKGKSLPKETVAKVKSFYYEEDK